MFGLDTHILVRYLAQDDPRQAASATRVIERELTAEEPGYISLVVLAEVVWVMSSVYGADRSTIAGVVEGLLASPKLKLQSSEVVWQALSSFRESRADFSDALIAHLAKAASCKTTLTFDRHASRLAGFQLLP